MPTLHRFPFRTLTLVATVVAATFAQGAADYSTPYLLTTFAGTSSIGSQDGSGTAARFFSPRDVTTDAAGNFYIVDTGNHTIRKITPAGMVSTFAGSPGEKGSTDGTGSAARFNAPQSIVADAADNLFVADAGNHTIRKITSGGVVTTFAGLAGVSGNANGAAQTARFNFPRRIALDVSGNLFVADLGNHAIRRITPAGAVSHYADADFTEIGGSGGVIPFHALAVDAGGSVYAAHSIGGDTVTHHSNWGDNYTVFAGYVSRFPTSDTEQRLWPTAWTKYFDGRVTNHLCSDIDFDPAGRLAAVDGFTLTRATLPDLTFTALAGDGTIGSADGPAANAKFGFPLAIAYDRAGNLAIADTGNNVVCKLSAAGEVTTVAGLALERATGTTDGVGDAARFVGPTGIVADAAGNIYVADTPAHAIRKITPNGTVTTLAGSPGEHGATDGLGAVARFNAPRGLALGPDGALYVTDTANHTLRVIAPDGTVTTLAGSPGEAGSQDGQGAAARFIGPYNVAVAPDGNAYVYEGGRIRQISPKGAVVTLPGVSNTDMIPDRTAGLAFSPEGRLFLSGLFTVYEVSPTTGAFVRLLAGDIDDRHRYRNGQRYVFGDDGTGSGAHFYDIRGLSFDRAGNLYLTDVGNYTVRKIDPSGRSTTLAGLAGADPGHHDGVGSRARFFRLESIAVDHAGTLYVTDGGTIRRGLPATAPVIGTQPASVSANTGNNATFTVAATAIPAPTYQWYVNGQPFSGATSATLSLTHVRPEDAGDYTVVVANELGSVTSAKATLTVTTAPPQPAPSGGGSSGGGGGAPSVWFVAVAVALGTLRRLRRDK